MASAREQSLLVAICEVRPVVRPPVVETAHLQ
jgi:hypothetical protein